MSETPAERTASDYLIAGLIIAAFAAIPAALAVVRPHGWLWLIAGVFVAVGQLVALIGIIAKGVEIGARAARD